MAYPYHISIIIVNYNVRHFVVECLESIIRSDTDGLEVEVWVVDNASIDGSVDLIKNQYPNVNVIANAENVGFSKANNQAIKQAKGEYILLLNPDTVLEENTLRTCYEYMQSHREVGALGVKMIDGAGVFLPESKRALPSAWNSFTKLVGLSSVFSKSALFNGYALGHLSENEQHNIQVLCGAFMFMPSRVLDDIGLLDERFFMYGEDIDLSYRIIKGGYEVHYIPDTTIIHYKGESTKKGSLNYVKTFYHAMELYVDKHYTGAGASLFGRFLKGGIWLRAVISALRRVVASLLPLAIDYALVFLSLLGFSWIWAQYYFKDTDYYQGTSLLWNIALYTSLWVGIAWLIGYYKKRTWKKRIQTILIGTVVTLGLYGLLDESFRTSRVLILVGGILAWGILSLTSWVRSLLYKEHSIKNVLIVASKERAATIQSQIKDSQTAIDLVGTVYPGEGKYDPSIYTNNLTQLAQLTKVMKVNEVIFSTEDMSTKEIMKTMIKLDSSLSFKIAGDESLNILGSKSKNTSGEIYNVDLQYNLHNEYYQHIKRMGDVGLAVLLILLFPLTILINGFRIGRVISILWKVLTGAMTWTGYDTSQQTLPAVQEPVWKVDDPRVYARDYTLFSDIEVAWKHRFKL